MLYCYLNKTMLFYVLHLLANGCEAAAEDRTIIYCYEWYSSVKSVQIWSFFWSVFSCIRAEYGPEKTPYLDTFHAV